MKIRYYSILNIILFLGMILYGLIQSNTYSDLNSDESPLEDKFVVGIFPDSMIDGEIDILNDLLDEQNYILAVTCTEDPFYRFSCMTQSVVVNKVFSGDDVNVGDELSLLNATEIYNDDEFLINGKYQININFTNAMTVGNQYLVFLDRTVENEDSSDHIMKYSDEILITPCFSYKETFNNSLKSESADENIISYSNCSKNEFFMESQDSIDKMIDLKNSLLAKYPL